MNIHAINTDLLDLNTINDNELHSESYHKDESTGRIKTDATDRNSLKEKIDMSIDFLDPDQHPDDGPDQYSDSVERWSVILR